MAVRRYAIRGASAHGGTVRSGTVRPTRSGAARRGTVHSGTVRSGSVQGTRSGAARDGRNEGRILAQLAVCSGAFVLLVAAKLLIPSRAAALRTSLDAAMERNLDVGQVFSAVGRAVAGEPDGAEEIWQAVFQPVDGASWDSAAGSAAGSAADGAADGGPIGGADSGTDGGTDGGTVPAEGAEGTGAASGDTAGATEGTAVLTSAAVRLPAVRARDGAAINVLRQYRNAALSGDAAGDAGTGTDPGMGMGTGTGFGMETGTGGTGGASGTSREVPDNASMEQAILNFRYCTPVLGTLTSGFGWRTDPIQGTEKFHYGLDLAVESGTDVLCFADGTVSAVGESTSYGKYCMVDHAGNFTTLYAHCERIAVNEGAAVTLGQKIAEAGSTGMSTGPHLHFELHRGGMYLNPVYYVAHT